MKAIKAEELRELSVEELQKKLISVEMDFAELKFKHSLNQLENPMLLRTMKRDIARINTILTAKNKSM